MSGTMRIAMLVLAGSVAGLPAAVAAAGKKAPRRARKGPARAVRGPDFRIQGEYAGEIPVDGAPRKLGAQVIALGKGTFRAVILTGGLPGAGWDGTRKTRIEGRRVGRRAVFGEETGDGWAIEGRRMQRIVAGSVVGSLAKVLRRSPTLGLKPPSGAVVLFDGTTAGNFVRGRMDGNKLLAEGTTSKRKFGDHIVHLEFRGPFQPDRRGQGRGNSGMYLQGRYEVQILDSFGLEGKRHECGGIYGVSDPKVNMCFPPLSWQTYDVQFTAPRFDAQGKKTANARMTVYHNGVLVHEGVEVPHPTTAAPFRDEQPLGPLFLQEHGSPLRFRNIWVLEVDAKEPASLRDLMKRWTAKE